MVKSMGEQSKNYTEEFKTQILFYPVCKGTM